MSGERKCFVCGSDHRSNDPHSRDELFKAVQMFNNKHRKDLITIENVFFIKTHYEPDQGSEDNDVDSQWAKEKVDESDDSDLTYVETTDL